jgi:uncharacterized SAM-binding protein YcdF (DUF218 family)
MIRRVIRDLFTLGMLLVLAAVLTFLYVGWRVNHTGSRDRAQSADAIIILGARVEPGGEPGPDLRVRTLHAVGLFHDGYAPYIVCTGGYQDDQMSAAAVACKQAILQGIPPERVLLADGSMTTKEDAARASDLMEAYGWQSAILVSHPLHLERASLLFESEGLTIYTSPTNTHLSSIPWRTRAWLTAREGVGIVWMGLEQLGLPDEWMAPVSRWVYGPLPPPTVP